MPSSFVKSRRRSVGDGSQRFEPAGVLTSYAHALVAILTLPPRRGISRVFLFLPAQDRGRDQKVCRVRERARQVKKREGRPIAAHGLLVELGKDSRRISLPGTS